MEDFTGTHKSNDSVIILISKLTKVKLTKLNFYQEIIRIVSLKCSYRPYHDFCVKLAKLASEIYSCDFHLNVFLQPLSLVMHPGTSYFDSAASHEVLHKP